MSGAIVLAVYPSAAEALPALERALGGPGKPDGVLEVRPCDGGLVVTWDPSRSAVRLVIGVIDAELRRYNATRRTELLEPLPLERLTQIAAQELHAPEIAPDRVLEALLAQAGLAP
jgi:hypothetical protein